MMCTTTKIADFPPFFPCPCCGKPLKFQMIESEGKWVVGLFHNTQEATHEQLSQKGYEFGVPMERGGEEDYER